MGESITLKIWKFSRPLPRVHLPSFLLNMLPESKSPQSLLNWPCADRSPSYRVAHLIRRKTPDVRAAADRLFIQRAFTCYQMLALLESTPARPQPYLILDLLATYYDDHVLTRETSRLLDACLTQLERLRHTAPVAVTLAPPLLEERAFLVERVCAQADTLFTLELPESGSYQPVLL